MNKHTSGPWVIEAVGQQLEVCNEETLYTVCKVNGNGKGPQANASLVAAAPDLLAFAQSLVDAWKSKQGMPDPYYIASAARAVIAKATGEEA